MIFSKSFMRDVFDMLNYNLYDSKLDIIQCQFLCWHIYNGWIKDLIIVHDGVHCAGDDRTNSISSATRNLTFAQL